MCRFGRVCRCVRVWCGGDHLGALLSATMLPNCKAITNVGTHFFSSYSSQEVACVGQELRTLSLRPLERHSDSEHRAQTGESKPCIAPQGLRAGGC